MCDKWLAKQSGTLPGGPEKGVLKSGGGRGGPGEVFKPYLAGQHQTLALVVAWGPLAFLTSAQWLEAPWVGDKEMASSL